MPKFNVKIQEIHTQVIQVDAEDEQAAQAAAEEVLACGVNQDGTDLIEDLKYDSTVERSEWPVWAE